MLTRQIMISKKKVWFTHTYNGGTNLECKYWPFRPDGLLAEQRLERLSV